jgi:hypothetical protein
MPFMTFQNTWPFGPGQSQWLCRESLEEITVAKSHESGEKPGPLGPDKFDSSDFFTLRRID